LTVHGIKGEEASRKRQSFNHRLRGRDSVAFLIDLQMTQDQRVIDRECA